LFEQLVDPLVANRSIRLATRGIRTDRDAWYDIDYDYADIDVVLLEGIFLFKRALVSRYDLRIWIECSFETALQRALGRNVEDLPADRLVQDYAGVYHASQRHHFMVDDPAAVADLIYVND
jgi:uridine kinase